MNEPKLIVIFEGPSVEAEMLKGLLDANNITAYLNDANLGRIAPWYVSPGGISPVKLLVPETEVEKAKAILDGVSPE
ncbi:MAG: DUF2007 domain-containing protein [FCB group bacterium]|nr:DUF2007 domain-containing protein [FCB group bacterium]